MRYARGMTLRSLLPTLVLSLALAACAKASDDPLEEAGGGAGGESAGGQAGTTAGKGGSGGKSGAGGKSGGPGGSGKAGSTSGTSGQSGEGGSDGGSAGEDPGGASGSDGGEGGEGGAGGSAAGKGGSSGTSGQGGTGTAGTPGCQPVVVINEVSPEGKGGGLDEFVELYNASDCMVDLAGWTLYYLSNDSISFQARISIWKAPSSQPLASKGYLVLASSGFTGSQDGALSSGLSKSGAGLALFDASDTRVDSMAWGTASTKNPCIEGTKLGAIGTDVSAARTPNGQDTDNNADDFKIDAVRTPGKANP